VENQNNKIGYFSASSLVIANIIGTGIFTTTGFTLMGVNTTSSLLMIWLVGGILAICGALSYGEVSSSLPESGGEYYFLSKIYHPMLGFIAGFVSLVAGFAAPVAASSMAFGKYLTQVINPNADPQFYKYPAVILVVAMAVLHSTGIKKGTMVQNFFSMLKVGLIFGFILAGFFITPNPQPVSILPADTDWNIIFGSAFATSLVYISFSYSGWNAAAYISGEVKEPQKNVPLALITGASIVMLLYLLVNYVFLYSTPIPGLAGKEEVGHFAAISIFGEYGGKIVSTMISLGLVSAVSAMVLVGPRVTQSMGKDFSFFRILAQNNANGVPLNAILLQCALSILIIFSGDLGMVIKYIGSTLALFTFLTVSGLFVLRSRNGGKALGAVATWGYPVTPILFLILEGWMIYHTYTFPGWGPNAQDHIHNLTATGLTLFIGAVLYFVFKEKGQEQPK